jgi:hypothetical protein
MPFYELMIRADFLLAVALLVVVPLGLLAASVGEAAVRDRLLVYWRASSLLGITVYLWAGEDPMGFATGFAARALIPLALWRGDALMVLRRQPLPASDSFPARAYAWWWQAAIAYNVVGVVYMLPLLACVFGDVTPLCQAWYEPPKQFTAWLHPTTDPVWLARYGWVALGLYAAYLFSTAMRLQRDLVEG